MTTLERFIRTHSLSPIELARASACSARYLLLVRQGKLEPTVGRAHRIALAVADLTGEIVSIESLFLASPGVRSKKRKVA